MVKYMFVNERFYCNVYTMNNIMVLVPIKIF